MTLALYGGKIGQSFPEAYMPAWVEPLRMVERFPGVPPSEFGVDFKSHIWRMRVTTLMEAESYADEMVEEDRKNEEKKRKRQSGRR